MTTLPYDVLKNTLLDPPSRIADIIANAPRLADRVRVLESDRLAPLADLRHADPADIAADADLRGRLAAFRQRSADLLYQAYEVDLGGET